MLALSTVGTAVYARDPGTEFGQVCSGIECWIVEALDPVLFLLGTGVLFLALLVALSYIREAETECQREQARVASERDAFERFAARVADLEFSTVRASANPAGVAFARADPADKQLARVEDAYRETVMSVDHFEEDYGETFQEHVQAEYGEEIATAVGNGTRLTPQLQQALVSRSREASRERTELISTLEAEAESLAGAREALTDFEAELSSMDQRPLSQRSFDELSAAWRELDGIESACETVLAERQRRFEDGIVVGHKLSDGHEFNAYLYEPLDVTYPVLADGAGLIERIRTAKRRVTASLTRRV